MRNPWEEFEMQFKAWIAVALLVGYIIGLIVGKVL